MSSFSSYSAKYHGGAKDHTGCILSSEDAKLLKKHGFDIGATLRATGFIGSDGTAEIQIARERPTGSVHPYDSRGSVWFEVASDDIRFRDATGERKLKLNDSVHVSKLTALLRGNKIFLVSTPRSRFSEARTRKGPVSPSAIRMADMQQQNHHLSRLDTPSGRYLPGLVLRQGDGVSLQLSRDVADQIGLVEGARVEIEPTDDGRLIITRSRRHFTLDELLAGMTPEREPPLEDDGPRGEEVI